MGNDSPLGTVQKVQHLHLYAAAINPRHCQCYSEESLVGSVALIGCVAGG